MRASPDYRPNALQRFLLAPTKYRELTIWSDCAFAPNSDRPNYLPIGRTSKEQRTIEVGGRRSNIAMQDVPTQHLVKVASRLSPLAERNGFLVGSCTFWAFASTATDGGAKGFIGVPQRRLSVA